MTARRRRLTVLFCDLVGSTELNQALGLEAYRALLRRVCDVGEREVRRAGGEIAQFMGDGFLAYFGYPGNIEDAAANALFAALEIAPAVARMEGPDGRPLAVRIGVDAGETLVESLTVHKGLMEEVAVGLAPVMAFRLQGRAAPGGVLATPQVRKLAGERFVYAPQEAMRFAGFDDAVRPYAVLRALPGAGRFGAGRGRAARLTGRRDEIAKISEAWRRAREGQGGALEISGSPGWGKSRLAFELVRRARKDRALAVMCQCEAVHAESALRPIRATLGRRLGLRGDAATQARRLEAAFPGARDEALTALADLLGVAPSRAWRRPSPDDGEPRSLALDLLVERAATLGAERPLLLLFEDLQWADRSTIELARRLARRASSARVLVLATSREAGLLTEAERLALKPLSASATERLVRRALGETAVDDDAVARAAATAEGVPLFALEWAHWLEDRAAAGAPLPMATETPSVFGDMLAPRLDRLGEAREVAECAAALGRDFDRRLLAAVIDEDQRALDASLDALERAEICERRAGGWAFVHHLVRDTAYERLGAKRRARVHGRIAQILETRFPERVEDAPEIAAQHHAEAGHDFEAARYFVDAAQKQIRSFAFEEACAVADRARRHLDGSEAGDKRRPRLALTLELTAGDAAVGAEGMAAERAGAAFAAAASLAAGLGLGLEAMRANGGLFANLMMRGEVARANGLAEGLYARAETEGDPAARFLASRFLGAARFNAGKFDEARRLLGRTVFLADDRGGALSKAMGQIAIDQRAIALAYGCVCDLMVGDAGAARRCAEDNLARAEEGALVHGLAFALTYGAGLALFRRDWAEAARIAEKMTTAGARERFPHQYLMGIVQKARADAEMGRADRALPALAQAFSTYEATGARSMQGYAMGHVAAVFLAANQPADALTRLDGAMALVRETGERWYEADLIRLRGEALWAAGAEADAMRAWLDAEALALAQGASFFALEARLAHGERRRSKGLAGAEDAARLRLGLKPFVDADDLEIVQRARALISALDDI